MNCRTSNRLLGGGLALLALGLAPLPAMAAPNSDSVSIVQKGFEGLKHGSFGDSGANTYVSAKGNLQTIHRWDLNRDGEIDLVFTQDHNHDYSPDAMIYWGGSEGPESLHPDLPQYRSPYTLLKHMENALKKVTWLPSLGGGRCVIADLNNDGFEDIVSGNMMHNFRQDMPAYIYWGSAQGFRESDRTILPGYIAAGIAVGDLNEDGLPDIVIANQGFERGFDVRFGPMINNLESYVYWGHPTGFDASRRSSIPTISASDTAIGDFNGDKHLDLAFVNNLHEEQSAYVYWGDGSGKFGESSRQVLQLAPKGGEKIEMHTALASDLNGDGVSDLVVAGSASALVFHGGKGGLSATRVAELPADNSNGLEAADLNGDGQVDLVVANAGSGKKGENEVSKSVIYWGDKGGYRADRSTQLATIAAMSVKAGDLNKDGFPDLVFGNATPAQGFPAQIFWGSARGYADERRKELHAFGAIGVGIADLNRDGNQDVVLLNHLSGSEASLPTPIYWGNKEHHYSSNSVTHLLPGGYMMYTIADFDDNNYPDLVLVTGGSTWILWGGASGYDVNNRTELPIKSLIGGENVSALNTADVNNDGYLDLICVGRLGRNTKEGSPQVIIVYGSARQFKEARTETFSLIGGAGTTGAIALSIADLNKDGHLDLVFPLIDIDRSQIRWGGPNGYASGRVTTLETNGATHAGVADLDRDGWLDVVFTSGLRGKRLPDQPVVGGTGVEGTTRNSFSFIYWGNPQGELKERTQFETYNALDVTIADLNRDGHLDLAFSSYLSDTTRELPAIIYWGDGTRGYGEKKRTFLDAASSASMDALDLNRDGWLELIITNHQKNFSHLSGTNIYWGGEKGYSTTRRTNIPTMGPHMDAMVDAGNIYTRAYEWDYISAPIEAPKDHGFAQLQWKAVTELGTGVKFQVRSATTQQGLGKAKWTGPDGDSSYYTASGSRLSGIGVKDGWLQYRAVLTSRDGANSPVVSEVEIICARR